MSNRINYKDAEQSLEEFLDSCYFASHSNATLLDYKSAIISKTNGFRKFLRERHGCDKIQLCEQIAKMS